MTEKEIQIIPRYRTDNGKYLYSFRCFNITNEDVALGLRHIKEKVRKEFKQLAKRYHPDTFNSCSSKETRPIIVAYTFKKLLRMRNRMLKLKTMPITMDNLEVVLDINKGYKSTRDVVLPWE